MLRSSFSKLKPSLLTEQFKLKSDILAHHQHTQRRKYTQPAWNLRKEVNGILTFPYNQGKGARVET